jgi:DnaJ-class molecular chaperone
MVSKGEKKHERRLRSRYDLLSDDDQRSCADQYGEASIELRTEEREQ